MEIPPRGFGFRTERVLDPILEYRNLDLWVERDASGKGRYVIRAVSDSANLRAPAASDPAKLGIDVALLAENKADAAYVKALGTRLHDFLFETSGHDKVRSALDRSLGAAQAGEFGLRIRLMLANANPEVAAVPWEFLYADALGGFIACSVHTPVVRFLEVNRPLKKPEA